MTNSQTETALPRPQFVKEDAADESGLRRMLSIEQVVAVVPYSAVTLWRMEKAGRFPRGSFISPNKKIWFEDEIIAWQREVDGRRRSRRKQPTREQREAAARKAALTRAKNRTNRAAANT